MQVKYNFEKNANILQEYNCNNKIVLTFNENKVAKVRKK